VQKAIADSFGADQAAKFGPEISAMLCAAGMQPQGRYGRPSDGPRATDAEVKVGALNLRRSLRMEVPPPRLVTTTALGCHHFVWSSHRHDYRCVQ
jgi:hypothetical protein